jgi:transcriptional regulator with XRE-family HTH domain
MKERLLEFLRNENKTSAQLAEEIGVQASGISHILSGRNNPSLDFVLKMLEKYPFLSTEWLLFGKGTMYRDSRMQSLFDEDASVNRAISEVKIKEAELFPEMEFKSPKIAPADHQPADPDKRRASEATKIVWFYADGSFEEYVSRR